MNAEGPVIPGGYLGRCHQLIQIGIASRGIDQTEADAHGPFLHGLFQQALHVVQLFLCQRPVLIFPLADDGANGAMAHILGHIHSQFHAFHLGNGLSIAGKIVHGTSGPSQLFLLMPQAGRVLGGIGCAAMAADIGGDALARLVVAFRVAEHRHIGMGMGVNKAGGHIMALGVQHLFGLGLRGKKAYKGDLSVLHRHIGPERRVACAVDHLAAADNPIIHGFLPPLSH